MTSPSSAGEKNPGWRPRPSPALVWAPLPLPAMPDPAETPAADWSLPFPPDAEWLEPDGRGGFASGTVAGERTRRYHALLLTANAAGRWVLVNGLEAWLEFPGGAGGEDERRFLSTQRYGGDTVFPRGRDHLLRFRPTPWPRWTFGWADGLTVEQEIVVVPGPSPLTLLRWRLVAGPAATLHVRPLLSGRDYHALHAENAGFDPTAHGAPTGGAEAAAGHVAWRPYPGVPATLAWGNGRYRHAPEWYRGFVYREEQARGLPAVEDLAAPGEFTWELTATTAGGSGGAVLALAAEGFAPEAVPELAAGAAGMFERLSTRVAARRGVPGPATAAGAYLIENAGGPTLLAGYPWFTDWGRDTFIALRGLCLATGRLAEAGRILARWAGAVDGGMLPNRFPDGGAAPEFNGVDASLWFVIAAYEYLQARPDAPEADALGSAVAEILVAYAEGTGRFGIGMDPADGLLTAGIGHPDVALTWMDARVNGRPVTPRAGKAVEIQALWLNALHLAGANEPDSEWRPLFERGWESFHARFWLPAAGRLRDVADPDDDRFRPNMILAVGGLPLNLLPAAEALAVVAAVGERLVTPLGLRSLAPGEPGYRPRYAGNMAARDEAYHQGTAWPWLLGPFVEAWVRVRGNTAEAKREARRQFLDPLWEHLHEAGLGHLPEVADAEAPHRPGGCPFQAWSLGEALRLDRVVLAG